VQTRDTGLSIHTADIPTDGFVPGRDIVFTWMSVATGEWIGTDYNVTIGDG
jgi:hypothetical protein